ncbi:hypothetical protein L4C36_08080 [Photobacterium japonica]|uniref:hypothetical protein n=1 Tax=Photobacterium japonica TaxID=2910235 RepID=UPI003D096568
MNITQKKFIALFLLLASQGCTSSVGHDNINNNTVTWSTGFTLSNLLISPITLNSINDIPNLITANWYGSFTVKNKNNDVINIDSCQDYLERKPLTTVNYYDINPFLNITVMCEAAKYLIDAKPSQVTYLPTSPLDKALPLALPKEIALQTSTNEYKRTMDDESLTFWGEIRPIIRFESISESKAIYHFDGGYQEIDIVGRGDVNHDKVEDLIVVIRDSLEGGSYFNLRLFILSFNKNREWSVIEEI